MNVVRHGKPAKAYLETLRSPVEGDYKKLVNAALGAIIEGERDVLVAFAYILKFPDDFPKGILVEKVDDRNVHRIKSKKLLRWLNDNGHTEITMDMLRGQVIAFGMEAAKWDRLFEQDGEEEWEDLLA